MNIFEILILGWGVLAAGIFLSSDGTTKAAIFYMGSTIIVNIMVVGSILLKAIEALGQ